MLGSGVLVYRVVPLTKLIVKVAHGFIHAGVAVCIVVGLVAVFKFHNAYDLPNLYSLHSWIGLATVVMFGMQVCLCTELVQIVSHVSYNNNNNDKIY